MSRAALRALGPALAIPLLTSGCVEDAAEITEVAMVVFNAVARPTPERVPGGTATVDRYGTVSFTPGGDPVLVREDSVVVTLTLTNLETLAAGSAYTIWIRTTAGTAAAEAEYTQLRVVQSSPEPGVIVEDTQVVAGPTPARAFSGDAALLHRLRLRDPRLRTATHVFLGIGSPQASTPGPEQPLWLALPPGFDPQDPQGTITGNRIHLAQRGETRFGTFDAADPARARPFPTIGSGLIGVRRERAEFVELIGEFQGLPLPPVGYHYQAWLVGGPAERPEAPAGEVTGPPPARASLRDADLVAAGGERPDPVVLPTGIVTARTRLLREELGDEFGRYPRYVVTLEPKRGRPDARAPTVAFSADMPRRVLESASR